MIISKKRYNDVINIHVMLNKKLADENEKLKKENTKLKRKITTNIKELLEDKPIVIISDGKFKTKLYEHGEEIKNCSQIAFDTCYDNIPELNIRKKLYKKE